VTLPLSRELFYNAFATVCLQQMGRPIKEKGSQKTCLQRKITWVSLRKTEKRNFILGQVNQGAARQTAGIFICSNLYIWNYQNRAVGSGGTNKPGRGR